MNVNELQVIEAQIAELKQQRDNLLIDVNKSDIAKILSFRNPSKTLCQLLRELHEISNEAQRAKIEQCLLIAKKMNAKLVEYAGKHYSKDWYDADGEFIGAEENAN
jgi:hypothetical protein